MDTFKIKINLSDRFVIKYITATDEQDACWIAKDISEKLNGISFNLMHA